MRQRLLLANLVLVALVLGLLEVPLAIVYTRHEHDSAAASLSRDASSLAGLSEEIIEHPAGHDLAAFARRFSAESDATIVIVDATGRRLTSNARVEIAPEAAAALQAAQSGRAVTGESRGLTYAAVPVGGTDAHGAALIARSDRAPTRRAHRFWAVLVAIGAAVLAVSTAVSHRLARWAVDPLEQLDQRAAEFGRGDFRMRSNTTTGPPEVTALARTFNEMADRLDDLVQSQRRFVAEASHQLRTPLTALRLRLENLDGGDGASTERTRDAALVETARLTRLVDGLLALARSEHRPDRATVDVAGVARQRCDAWMPVAEEAAVRLGVDIRATDEPIEAMLVPGYLEQVLDNLIDNAIEATQPGRRVDVLVDRVPAGVSVHVVDQGRGMSDAERRQAFDPFWRGDTADHGGTGLGLAIVDRLVRASGGSVRLARADSGGVDAVVVLPGAGGLGHDADR